MHAGEAFALLAPLSGPIVPLTSVPDPVFSEGMVGDGISIDPLSQTLLAPCDGAVTQLHAARHAITLKTDAGVEILIHIGLDTVQLKGEGFTARVREGDRVKIGQPLIDFDADSVLRSGRSPLTQIVITSGEVASIVERGSGMARAGESVLLTLAHKRPAPAPAGASAAASGEVSVSVVLPNPHGLHARPAAVLVNAARGLPAELHVELGGRRASARSLIGLLGLGAGTHAELRIVARGEGAAQAAEHLAALIRGGLGEAISSSSPAPAPAPDRAEAAAARAAHAGDDDRHLHGVTAAPGKAIGPIFKLDTLSVEVNERGAGLAIERARLTDALARGRRELTDLIAAASVDAEQAQIFGAHLTMLDDPETAARADEAIARGASAAFAWREAIRQGYEALAALDNPLLAARATDLKDVGGRVLLALHGAADALAAPPSSIVVAESLTPSDVVRLADQKVSGLVTVLGGTTSHVAILARSLGLPCLVGVSPSVLARAPGQDAVLDADRAVLLLAPTAAELADHRKDLEARAVTRASLEASAGERAVTRDGVHVEVFANIGNEGDARKAVRLGAEGVGLLRTEFMFLERSSAPTEAEQIAAYEAIAKALGDRPLIIRTLDVGGDKPLPYLPLPPEDNPLLGIRGLRIGWLFPEILRAQMRAILAARTVGPRRIMVPMVASVDEIREAKQILAEERARAGAPAVQLGIMVEVPSAAIQADRLAPEVDFFSIGTNDLTQYTLAMDRTHPRLAARQDGLHPAVLRLIDMTSRAGHKHKKPVAICGALGSDLSAIPVLVGLGVTELSVSVPAIPEVKATIRALDAARCRELARAALDLGTAAEVRALLAR